jgi:hypothetical protein
MSTCARFGHALFQNPALVDLTLFADEAWFNLSGYRNSQNVCFRALESLHTVREETLHSAEFGMPCAVSWTEIIGAIFLCRTINIEAYLLIFNTFACLLLPPKTGKDITRQMQA